MRPEKLNPLFRETESLHGVGKALAKPLDKLKLNRVRDLLFHLPTGWINRKHVATLDDAIEGDSVVLNVTPIEYRSGSMRGPFRVVALDSIGNALSLVFFGKNSGWPKKLLPLNETQCISGKLERFGDWLQIVHPEVVDVTDAAHFKELEPVYPLSDGITNRRMGQLVSQALSDIPELPEWIEPGLKSERNWPDWRNAVCGVHTRDSKDFTDRLAYDEIFANQLALMLVRADRRRKKGIAIEGDGHLRTALQLPFTMTGAQSRVIREIEGDMAQDVPMLRLLQGDVGSGKTLVALFAMLNAVEGGFQAAMLAPTEILARQHFATLQRMNAGLNVTIAMLTGRDKGRVRESTLMGLIDGSVDILIGTHAIFQDSVTYRNLGLVVIDEQHRFGVAQRLMLTRKADITPHLLAMTATPIPRTLMLSQYGEMECSRIDELPPGRQAIETSVIADSRIDDVLSGLARHLAAGRQAYWVCPLVEESEKSDLAAAEERAVMLRHRFGNAVGLVHGRMKGPDKDHVMDQFQRGNVKLLVATTVIEVGVDVPNASLMIIEAADRFGLAQLHQLRGRVGRGSEKSNCLLLRGSHLSETARDRLSLMRETNDGFRIAEEDLRLRGAGEILGTRQSGEGEFKLATPDQVRALIATATDDARLLIDRDGGLNGERGQAARLALYLFERDWGVSLIRSG